MKRLLGVSLLSTALVLRAAGAVFSQTFDSGFQNGGVIPDGSLNGWSDTRSVGMGGGYQVEQVQVTLNLSGGHNGDLYAYLTHGNATAILLNRVGVGQTQGDPFGYSDSGMHITLMVDGANGNIHWYGGNGVPTGAYSPDGRAIDPLSLPSAFDTASTSADFRSMQGLDPNGSWTLFFADVSGGGGPSTVSSWSLEIVGVPEPVGAALACFGLGWLGLMLGGNVYRRACNSSRARKRQGS